MEMLQNLLRIAEGERKVATTCRNITIAGKEQKDSEKKIPRKFRDDIENLKEKYPDLFLKGGELSLSLQDMLVICPRDRRRIDAYRGLCSYLKETWNIELTIKSNKTKDYGKEE